MSSMSGSILQQQYTQNNKGTGQQKVGQTSQSWGHHGSTLVQCLTKRVSDELDPDPFNPMNMNLSSLPEPANVTLRLDEMLLIK